MKKYFKKSAVALFFGIIFISIFSTTYYLPVHFDSSEKIDSLVVELSELKDDEEPSINRKSLSLNVVYFLFYKVLEVKTIKKND